MLRHEPPPQSPLFLEGGARRGTTLHPDLLRSARRHRFASRRGDAHEAHRRPAVRRRLSLVGARGGRRADAGRGDGGGGRRKRAVSGKSVSVSVDRGGRRLTKQKKNTQTNTSQASAKQRTI